MRLATIATSNGPRLHVRGRSGYVDVGKESGDPGFASLAVVSGFETGPLATSTGFIPPSAAFAAGASADLSFGVVCAAFSASGCVASVGFGADGSVELPYSTAKYIWPYLTYGTLVTVTPT